ncbi:MAG: DUF559 domain-containing protein [Rothia sp. (in: high G+C Gram-positive bacteria)]|nr:DUF559 domain-containing protein [Rothia sp. (in: high G+C Gram-positive bacteria)]
MKFHQNIKTLNELYRMGIGKDHITTKVKSGQLIRLQRGVYTNKMFFDSLEPFELPIAKILTTAKGSHGVAVSYVSAALWWGVPLIESPSTTHLSSTRDISRRKSSVTIHRHRPEIANTTVLRQGVAVTTPYQTLQDCLTSLPWYEVLNIANFFLAQNLLTFRQVFEVFDKLPQSKKKLASWLAERLNTQCESALETLVFITLCDYGLPRPAQQVWLDCGYGHRARVDFCGIDQRVILEADGAVKYSGQFGDAVDVIKAERARQRDLERLGWTVIRIEWKDARGTPEALIQRLWDAGVR